MGTVTATKAAATIFAVELIKEGKEYFPAQLMVRKKEIRIISPSGKLLSKFSFEVIPGWSVTRVGFRLHTDRVGTFLDMRTSSADEIAAACSRAAEDHLLCFGGGQTKASPLLEAQSVMRGVTFTQALLTASQSLLYASGAQTHAFIYV